MLDLHRIGQEQLHPSFSSNNNGDPDVPFVVDHIPPVCVQRGLQRKDVIHARRWDMLLEIVLTEIG